MDRVTVGYLAPRDEGVDVVALVTQVDERHFIFKVEHL
jgi:hypothetical protein